MDGANTAHYIDLIYQAAFDLKGWDALASALYGDFPELQPVFFFADAKSGLTEHVSFSPEWHRTALSEYQAYYSSINPWASRLASWGKPGHVFNANDLLPDNVFKRTEFYNDFLIKLGDWTRGNGVVLGREENFFSMFALQCGEVFFERSRCELQRLVTTLAPHMQRSLAIARTLSYRHAFSAATAAILEVVPRPALLVNDRLSVVHANKAGNDLLSNGTLSVGRSGMLCSGADHRVTSRLREALHLALRGMAPPPCAIPASPAGRNPGVRLFAGWAIPWRQHDREPFTPYDRFFGERFALLVIADPKAAIDTTPAALSRLFGLTPAECRLAIALANGVDVKSYAEDAGITIATARVQLKSVFAKTDTHRQSELAVLVNRLSAPFTPPTTAE